MSYIDESLGQNETAIYRARFPWFYHARGWVGLIVLAVCGLVAYAGGFGLLAGLLVLAGLALFIANLLPIWTTEIGVTDQRLIFKRGLLWRTTQELQLRAIEEVNLEQGFFGRLTNYGRLELRGTGVDDIVLPTLADPLGLRKALQDGMAIAAHPMATPAPTMPVAAAI
jgi:hypothetical protein